MKGKIKMFGAMRNIAIIALTAVIMFSMAACDTGGGSDSSTTYTGVLSGSLDIYELVITRNGSSPAVGDAYTLTLYNKEGTVKGKSSGTISSISGGTYNLSNGTSVVATISDGALKAVTGTINKDGGGTLTPASSLTGVKAGGDGSLNGTWKKGAQTVTFSGSNFTYKGDGITAPGTAYYSTSPGILVTAGTYSGDNWIVAGNYTLTPNVKIAFSEFSGSMGSYYSGDWTK